MHKTRPICPKCGSKQVELIEIWSAFISWDPSENYSNEGILEPGDPEKVEGNCLNCGHKWRIRGVIQVQREWFDDFGKD